VDFSVNSKLEFNFFFALFGNDDARLPALEQFRAQKASPSPKTTEWHLTQPQISSILSLTTKQHRQQRTGKVHSLARAQRVGIGGNRPQAAIEWAWKLKSEPSCTDSKKQ
jgi:hypothetical protein